MAATTERIVEIKGERPPAVADLLAANQTIYAGSVAMQDAGKIKKYAPGVAGHAILGLTRQTLISAGVDVSFPQGEKPTFGRGCMQMKILGGAPVTQAHIGKKVRLEDEDTVSANAIGANDASFYLRAIEDGMAWVDVE